MPSPQVWLGLAGDLVEQDLSQDHFSTRIGGSPVFPGEVPPSCAGSSSKPLCQVCGRCLSLVLQAYAPLPALPDRVIQLYGCTHAGCGTRSGCWMAIRCQLNRASPPPTDAFKNCSADSRTCPAGPALQGTSAGAAVISHIDSQANMPVPTQHTVAGGFQAADAAGFSGTAAAGFPARPDVPCAAECGSYGDGDASQRPGNDFSWDVQPVGTVCDAFDFSDLTSSLAAAAQQHQQHQQKLLKASKEKSKQPADTNINSSRGDCPAVNSSKGSAGPLLPEFYLYAEEEPGADSSKCLSSKDRGHVQQLLAAYEAAEALDATCSTTTSTTAGPQGSHDLKAQPPRAAAAAAADTQVAEGSTEEGASWAGEAYEPDSVGCMQRSYLKFTKRIARQPQQCVRYCRDGPLLWPQSQSPQPAPCALCGSPRVFELQLMPAVSHMVLEAAQMLQEQGCSYDAAVVNAAANWDWCTVAVFTCQSSCSDKSESSVTSGCQLVVEQVAVITEIECETASLANNL